MILIDCTVYQGTYCTYILDLFSHEFQTISALYYNEQQWRSQGGARGGDRPPNSLPGHSCEKFKSGEKLVGGGGGVMMLRSKAFKGEAS